MSDKSTDAERETRQPESEPAARMASVERLASMTIEEVDDLPYGFIVLDTGGQILLYNRYEARMSRIAPERVIGQNFFHDIAPCTRVEAFFGRFRALVSDPTRQEDRFSFRFHFLHGAQNVIVQFARAPEITPEDDTTSGVPSGPTRIFMTVMRRMLDSDGKGALPSVLHLDADRGRILGPLGPVFPIGAQLPSILGWLGAGTSRDIGREIGRTIAGLAADAAQRTGEVRLKDAPVLLVAGALDEAMANNGLGRLALDLTPRNATGVVGCLVRPPLDLPSRGLAALYEGIVEAALSVALDIPLVARCIDERDLSVVPWRFAAVAEENAEVLERRPDERTGDLAQRLGLLVDEDL